jgi:uncharacterized protein (TIGR00297 family)
MPAKALPPSRDRLQSRLLVWIVAPLIALACAWTIYFTYGWEGPPLKALALGAVFALAAWFLRAATPAAALSGGMICLILTLWTGSNVGSPLRSALSPLLTLFILTFLATRTGRKQKSELGLGENRGGRSASQVIANLGVAALLSNIIGCDMIAWAAQHPGISDIDSLYVMRVVIVAALAEATADTVSSEIGQAFGGAPFMLTTLRRVPPGTDGAISLKGTLAGIAAAAIIAATGAPALGMSPAACFVAFAAGVTGLFFDSLLGATVERRGYINNDLVNFTSTAFAAATALLAIRFCGNHLFR